MESSSQRLTPELISKFSWAHILSENLQKMTENLVFTEHFLNSQVRPVAKSDLELLREEVGKDFAEWSKDYEDSLEAVIGWMLKSAQSQVKRSNDDLVQLVSSRIPQNLETLYSGSLSRYALHFCLGSLGKGGSMLSGFSQSHQVDDSFAVASSKEPFPSESLIALP